MRRNNHDDKGVKCKPIRCFLCGREIVVVHNAQLKVDYHFIACENCRYGNLYNDGVKSGLE